MWRSRQGIGTGQGRNRAWLASAVTFQEAGTNYNPFDYLAKKYTEKFSRSGGGEPERAYGQVATIAATSAKMRLPRSAEIQKTGRGRYRRISISRKPFRANLRRQAANSPLAALAGPGGVGRKLVTQAAIPGCRQRDSRPGPPRARHSSRGRVYPAQSGPAAQRRYCLGPAALHRPYVSQLPDFVTDAHIDRARATDRVRRVQGR